MKDHPTKGLPKQVFSKINHWFSGRSYCIIYFWEAFEESNIFYIIARCQDNTYYLRIYKMGHSYELFLNHKEKNNDNND